MPDDKTESNKPAAKPAADPTKGKLTVRHYIKQNPKIPRIAEDVLATYLRTEVGAFGNKSDYDQAFKKWMNATRTGKERNQNKKN